MYHLERVTANFYKLFADKFKTPYSPEGFGIHQQVRNANFYRGLMNIFRHPKTDSKNIRKTRKWMDNPTEPRVPFNQTSIASYLPKHVLMRYMACARFKKRRRNQPQTHTLPLPCLKRTLNKFLKTCEPFLNLVEMEETRRSAVQFVKGDGRHLHALIEESAATEENWLTTRWVDAYYLSRRDPLPVYSSPAVCFPRSHFHTVEDFALYAGQVIYGLLKFKTKVDMEELPISRRGNDDLDNSQFEQVFGTVRVPIHGHDQLEYYPLSNHVIILHKNHFYKLSVRDAEGNLYGPHVLANSVLSIILLKVPAGAPYGVLTMGNRDAWASAYEMLASTEHNREVLSEIETALFTVSLDKYVPLPPASGNLGGGALNTMCEQVLHGSGTLYNSANRWMDKTIQVILNPNGYCGITFEASPVDMAVIRMISDYVVQNLNNKNFYEDCSGVNVEHGVLEHLEFEPVNVDDYIASTQSIVRRLTSDLDVHVLHFKSFGTKFLLQTGIPADSFIQIALQCAYFKMYKKPAAQYEPVDLRIFTNGRSEAVRTCSRATLEFIRSMCVGGVSITRRYQLLQRASMAHRQYTDSALEGRGVDRHLFILRHIAYENNLIDPEFFSSPGYIKSTHFRLQTIPVTSGMPLIGCCGPLVDDGYSCCYNSRSDDIFFSITSWRSSGTESSLKFAESLFAILENMYKVVASSPRAVPVEQPQFDEHDHIGENEYRIDERVNHADGNDYKIDGNADSNFGENSDHIGDNDIENQNPIGDDQNENEIVLYDNIENIASSDDELSGPKDDADSQTAPMCFDSKKNEKVRCKRRCCQSAEDIKGG